MKFLLLLTVLFSTSAFSAEVKPLKACSEYAALDLAEDHKEWTETFNMLNAKGEVVGIYSYKDEEIHSAVCDYVSDDTEMTIANEWYYWEGEESANPATFDNKTEYWMAQDEGQAFFSVLKTSKTGEIIVQFHIIGFDGEGETVIVRNEVLTFKKAY